VFADMANFAGRPDGAAIDADGCYWIAGNDGSCLLRFTPEGVLDREIALPVAKPAMCSFGGPGMEWMLVTSIRPGDAPPDSPAGGVFLLRPGVRGVPDTPFAG
jgi:sugar lactone lactonase YvrE